jgi:hypothetical protein
MSAKGDYLFSAGLDGAVMQWTRGAKKVQVRPPPLRGARNLCVRSSRGPRAAAAAHRTQGSH